MAFSTSLTNHLMQTLPTGWKTFIKMHSVKDQVFRDQPKAQMSRLQQQNLNTGLWENTYAGSNKEEYFAVGTQCFFNNSRKGPEGSDGVHNEISTHDQLRDYDPGLYNLMLETFPCQNELIQRCDDQS